MENDFKKFTPKISSPPQKETSTPEEAPFKTPEQVASDDKPAESIDLPQKPTIKKPRFDKLHQLKLKFSNLPKKQKIIIGIVVALVVIAIAGLTIYALTRPKAMPPAAPAIAKPKPKAPAPVALVSKLTGLPVSADALARPVTGVMIENSTFARPQSGLSKAGVVFEAIAEGGITRFLALYQDNQAPSVGPIRSLRPYYLQWALAYDAPIAHVGGSPEALADLKTWGGKDLDQFYNGDSYQRITSRVAPHNVYTSIAKLNDLETSKGWTSSNFTGFTRKPEAPLKTLTANTIDISMSSDLYNPHYTYDGPTNTYKRTEAGQAFVDQDGGSQISPKVVAVMVMPQGIEADDKHTTYATIGSGQVYIFQDGGITIGNWQKHSDSGQLSFTDSKNVPIALNPGQTWITVVDNSSMINFKP